MNFRLWGKGAQPKPGASDADKTAAEDADKNAVKPGDDDDDEEDDEDDDKDKAAGSDKDGDEAEAAHDAAVAAAASVPAAARQAVVFLERERIHAILEAGGRDRAEQALYVALNTDMAAQVAVGFLESTGPDRGAPAPDAGRLGLRGDMATRRTPRLGADGAGDDRRSGEAKEIDDAAASILAHVPGMPRKS